MLLTILLKRECDNKGAEKRYKYYNIDHLDKTNHAHNNDIKREKKQHLLGSK